MDSELMDFETFVKSSPDEGDQVAMGTKSGESADRSSFVMSHGVKLEEKLWVDECYLFRDESLTPIFCKPKLIPLKTITTQKLEQMQKDQMEKMRNPESEEDKSRGGTPASIEPDAEREEAPSTSTTKEADVWTADD